MQAKQFSLSDQRAAQASLKQAEYEHEFEMHIEYRKDGSKKTTMKWFGEEL